MARTGDIPHRSDYGSLKESVLGFCSVCREHGLFVGLHHTREALESARLGFANEPERLRYVLRALFCSTPEEQALLDRLFDAFWLDQHGSAVKSVTRYQNQSNQTKKSPGSVVLLGFGDRTAAEETDSKNVSGANKVQVLRQTDFSKVAAIDRDRLDAIAERLLEQMSHRMRRKQQQATSGRIDLRRTIRANMSTGGLMLKLKHRDRRRERYRLVVLLDVSGSMDTYSFYLLRFIWSLKTHFKAVEAFIFSTRLIRITDFLDERELDRALTTLSREANAWSSGTQIGACLHTFNERYSRVLSGRTVTIILSDGLDTGPPEALAAELERIKLRTNKLVWLNPLKGMEGYAPLARGMAAALPSLDAFRSAHNLDSLLELEDLLARV